MRNEKIVEESEINTFPIRNNATHCRPLIATRADTTQMMYGSVRPMAAAWLHSRPAPIESNSLHFFLSAAHDDLSDKFLNEKSNEISSRKTNNRRAMPSIYNNSSRRRRRKCWNLMKKDNIGNYRSTFLKTNATYRSQLACCFTKCIKQINTFLLLYSFAESK